MDRDEQKQIQPSTCGRSGGFKLAALILTGVTVVVATGFLARLHYSQGREELPPTGQDRPSSVVSSRSYMEWPKPDVVLLLSGQQHGYLQPCGCSPIQLGGLARRYNLLQSLRDRGWPVVAGDVGDVAQTTSPQAVLKYKYSMEILKLLHYTAVGIGENEIALPLIEGLANFALENPSPRVVAANLQNKAQQFPNMVESYEVSDGKDGALRVGFVGVVARSVASQIQEGLGVGFDSIDKVLPDTLTKVQAKRPDLLVLLFQGNNKEAREYAAKYPQFQVVLCKSEEETPSARPDHVGNTLIITAGWKGRHVSLVGAYRTGKEDRPFDFRYELIELAPNFETPDGHDKNNPVHALMQRYAEEVRDGKYLEKYSHDARHLVQVTLPEAKYVGSQKCKGCHKQAYQIWLKHPHAHAYETLEKEAKRPTLRQYDGECIKCHVTGMDPVTGSGYRTGFRNETDTPQFKGVGCESCHGPGSLHVEDKNEPKYLAAINPWKGNGKQDRRIVNSRIDNMCQKCHDQDNSNQYDFDVYWIKKKTAHNNK